MNTMPEPQIKTLLEQYRSVTHGGVKGQLSAVREIINTVYAQGQVAGSNASYVDLNNFTELVISELFTGPMYKDIRYDFRNLSKGFKATAISAKDVADAKRYRYLREGKGVLFAVNINGVDYTGEELDNMIDIYQAQEEK